MEAQSTIAYAGIGKRIAALFIDSVILVILGALIGSVLGLMIGATGGSSEAASTIAGIVGLAAGWLYFAMMESSPRQATVGKQLLHIKVTDTSGGRLSFARATGRYFAKILSGSFFAIGYIMAFFTQRKQGLHDMIVGSVVVPRP